MPTHIRAHCQFAVGSLLPRDIQQITPCFRHQIGLDAGNVGWQSLCDDLANGLNTTLAAVAPGKQLTVKLYEIKDPVAGEPNRPQATTIKNAGQSDPPSIPQELAMCMSFYGGQNFPHQRGRLYLPAWSVAGNTGPVGLRPSPTFRAFGTTLSTLFAGLGGANVDWIVWSPTRKLATKVDHWYVDDEWDVQRRRGLVPGARTAGTTSG